MGARWPLKVICDWPWPVTPNFSVGGFISGAAVRDGVLDSADYAAAEWGTASSLGTPIAWAQLGPEFALHAYSVRTLGKFITGPQVPLDPVYHRPAQQLSFIRQGLSLIYALGASCYPCWDTFIQAAAGASTWRAFFSAADYNGMWPFISANPSLYNGFECCPTVAVIINGDQLVRNTSASWPANSFVVTALNTLLQAGVPFAISMYSNLDTAVPRNTALENACAYKLSTFGNNAPITETQVPDNWAVAPTSDQMAQAGVYWVSRVIGSTGSGLIYAIPRVNVTTKQIAVHIVNLQVDGAGAGVSEAGLTLCLNKQALDGLGLTAQFYAPGQSTASLTPTATATEIRMALPTVDERGAIVLLQMADSTVPGKHPRPFR